MNKMKKTLVLVLSMLAATSLLTACFDSIESSSNDSTNNSSVHEHDFSEVKADEDNHWNECECGEKQGETAHVYGEWQTNAEKHWKECECGAISEEAVHSGGEAACTGEAVCATCGEAYGEIGEHVYNVLKFDETKHWYECECGEAQEGTAHTYEDKFDENSHWEECSCGYKANVQVHSYEDKFDENNHWEECSCGYKANVEEHTFGAWQSNAEKHWKECGCGEKVEELHADALQYEVVEDLYQVSYACCGYEISFTETLAYFDRENKNILEANGNTKTNTSNYWDGAENIVSVAYADGITAVSFDTTKFTAEQLAAADAGWAKWSEDLSMWVGYAIPVNALDLNNVRISLRYKADNMSSTFVAYGAKVAAEGAEYAYITGDYYTVSAEDQVALEDGWYQCTFIITGETEGTTAADYIVLSLDNTAKDLNKKAASTAYIADVQLKAVSYCTITVDDVAKKVVVGDAVALEEPTKSGYKFLGWKDADGNDVESGFTATGDVTLVSQWEKLPIALKLGTNAVDISESISNNEFYVKYSFTAAEGTYSVGVTGGIKAFELANGEVTETALTQFIFTEETTAVFVITHGDNLEMQGNVKIEYIHNPEISESATKISSAAFRTDSNFKGILPNTDNLGDVSVPNGFTTISRFDSTAEDTATTNPWTSGVLNANVIDKIELSAYEEVWFAITLQNAYFNITGLGSHTPNGWVYFHLTKVGAELWKIEISINGETTTQNNQSGTKIDANTPTNAISTIFVGGGFAAADGGYVLIYHGGEGTASLWSTEIVGVKSEYNPNIPTTAETVAMSVIGNWSGFDYTDPNTDTNGVVAPKGFSTITRYDSKSTWTSSVLDANCYDKTDLSAYSEVWFAIKMVNGIMQVGVNGVGEKTTKATTLEDAKWIYFHLTQTATNVWTIEISIDGVAYKTLTNQDGTERSSNTTKLPTNGLSTILFGDGNKEADKGWVLFTREADGTTVNFYCTEVLGVKSAS